MLFNFTVKDSTVSSIKNSIAATAVFMKWRFNITEGRSLAQLSSRIYDQVYKEPWSFLGMTARDFRLTVNNLTGSRATVRSPYLVVVKELEILSRNPQNVEVKGTTLVFEDKHVMKVDKPKEMPMLPLGFETEKDCLMNYLVPRQRLVKRIEFYRRPANYSILRQKIADLDFGWLNNGFSEGVPESDRDSVSSQCRQYLIGFQDKAVPSVLVAFYYCFSSGKSVFSIIERHLKFRWFMDWEIDLSLETGALRILNGKIINFEKESVNIQERYEPLLAIMLPGYRMISGNHQMDYKESSINVLRRLKSVPDGAIFKVYLYGKEWWYVRDMFHGYNVQKTIMKHVASRNQLDIIESEMNLIKKSICPDEMKRKITSASVSRLEQTYDDFMACCGIDVVTIVHFFLKFKKVH